MADVTLQTESAPEQPTAKLDRLAGEIQCLALRLGALSHAADDAVDYSEEDDEKRHALGRASLLIQTMAETAAKIASMGEEVEILTLELKQA